MNIFRMTASEFWRMRRTGIYTFHILIPVLGAALFVPYFMAAKRNPEAEAQAYFQTVVIVSPLLIGILCGMAAEQEEQNQFQVFLTLGSKRSRMLSAKWLALFLLYAASAAVGIGGFAGLFKAAGEMPYPIQSYAALWILLLPGGSFLILFHLFLGLRFGMSASVGMGIFELPVAGVLLTGLGDSVWQLFPSVWAGRMMESVLSWGENSLNEAAPCAVVWLAGAVLIFLWFHFFEGKKTDG